MSTTNVLITGANRGLGFALVQKYLSRSNHTVIGSVRDISAAKAGGLGTVHVASGSKLVLVKIESASTADPAKAVEELEAQGIDRLDLVISNVGIVGTQGSITSVGADEFAHLLAVNAVGPVALFQAVKPLLDRASQPKWLSVSTAMSSIGNIVQFVEYMKGPACYSYGASKAALNHFTRCVHAESGNIVAVAVHPGFLDTDMGNTGHGFYPGVGRPTTSAGEAASMLAEMMDGATKEKESGTLLNFDGTPIPW